MSLGGFGTAFPGHGRLHYPKVHAPHVSRRLLGSHGGDQSAVDVYSCREFLAAWVLASLATIPVTMVSSFAVFLASAPFLPASAGGPFTEVLGMAVLLNLYTLPTAFLAVLVVSAPFVIRANRLLVRISRRSAILTGATAGFVVGGAWWAFLRPPITGTLLIFVAGGLDGLVAGYVYERSLP
jgi:hypothetical protein